VAGTAAQAWSSAPAGLTSIPSGGEPLWGLDIRLDNAGKSIGGRHLPGDADPSGFLLEKNLALAIDPSDPNRALAGYEMQSVAGVDSYYADSSDGGLTWRGGPFAGPYLGDLHPQGDAQVLIDSQGTHYYSGLSFGVTTTAYLLFTSTTGLDWNTPVPIIRTTFDQYHYPQSLAMDEHAASPYAGSLYFASPYYQNVDPYIFGMHVRYSRDRGSTWSDGVQVSDPGHQDSYKPSLAVASDGTIYVAFANVPDSYIGNAPRLYLDRSTDGGNTWGADSLITGAPITPIGEPDPKEHELVIVGNSDCYLLRINHNPEIALSATNPNEVYVVWNDGRWQPEQDACGRPEHNSDIAFSRTTDGGATWSVPLRLNDDPQGNHVDHWQPSIETDASGRIGVIWYDRRYDPQHYKYDVAYTQSTDGGLSWSANQRVSDLSSDANQVPDAKGIDDLGYRKDLAFGSTDALAGWIDTRDEPQQGHIYVDRGVFGVSTATATATNTPVLTTSPTATGTATTTASPTPCAISFSDVPVGSTFYTFVRCLACMGIVGGYQDGTFRPNNNVTRGQIAKIVSNAAGFNEPVSGQTFEDVPPGSTFYTYTERLASRGVMSGYPCGGVGEPCMPPGNLPYFRPNANATRGQISKIVANAAGFSEPVSGQTFEDVPPGYTFYEYVVRLGSRGIMSGYPCGGVGEPCVPPGDRPYFRPGTKATRGQSSKIVANTFLPACGVR
jgi:hypothetical protein